MPTTYWICDILIPIRQNCCMAPRMATSMAHTQIPPVFGKYGGTFARHSATSSPVT